MSASGDPSVLFVCTGNTCRSPMAERLCAHLCRSLPGWRFHSAGLQARSGAPATPEAVRVLREKGLDLSGHRARPLTQELLAEADWILVMTAAHAEWIRRHFPAATPRVRLLRSFQTANAGADVNDPFGGSLDSYRGCRDEIESALADFILAVIQPSP